MSAARVSAATLLVAFAHLPIAFADGQCPAKLSCAKVRERVDAYRRELRQLKARLDDKRNKDNIPDEAAVEREIAELGALAQCGRCAKASRSGALQAQAGIEGLLAQHYDGWGMKRGEDGRRSFRATHQAALVDAQGLTAWTSYGKALVAIAQKTFKDRIAKYLEIDLPLEMKTAAQNLTRLLVPAPSHAEEAHEVLASLERLMK